jgi:hypothetical protein
MQFAALHPESRIMLNSWRALNGLENDEMAQNIRARDASTLVDRLFMAQRVGEGVFTFTTIGKELKNWTGRDLRDHEVGSLFFGPDKVLVRALLEASISSPGPALARVAAFGAGEGQRTDIELVFLPLLEKNGTKRILGLFQPLAANISISRPALRFSLTALLPPDPQIPSRPELRIVANK